MIVSINDHPDIRRIFSGYPILEVEHIHTIGGVQSYKDGSEIIIRNKESCQISHFFQYPLID